MGEVPRRHPTPSGPDDAQQVPNLVRNNAGCISKDEEYHLAASAFGWGAWMLLPLNTFASSPTYRVMTSIAPEWIWGAGFFAFGLLKFYAAWRGSLKSRRRVTFWGCFVWLFLAIAHQFGNSITPAGVIYLSMAGASAGRYWRLGRIRGD